LPIVPGTDKISKPFSGAPALAREIGYPVIIKAAAGGGGKGMRVVNAENELAGALELAQTEALSAFGSGDVYLEKFIPFARHIEFQILGDRQGNTVHLGERECSIQRRYQKLLEECPSPYVSPELRNRIGEMAVRAARAVNYASAGTMEFVVDDQHRFYFMEMNTRIQVEHPVTEMVTGIDLIKEQIRIACGEQLGYTQRDITFRGHALECRINAESPDTFLPSPGTLKTFHPPTGIGIRVDTAAYSEYVITPHYDSLIAKIIAHGRDRNEAIRRMRRALEMTVVEGVQTTIPLHQKILDNEDFLAGRIHTRFLDQWVQR